MLVDKDDRCEALAEAWLDEATARMELDVLMRPSLRKIAFATHVIWSVGSVGAIAIFIALAVAGLTSPDAQMVRSAYIAMAYVTPLVIVPFVLGSLVSGLTSSLGTHWGLFRYYWVVAKLVLTVVSSVVLLLQLYLVARLGRAAAEGTTLGSSLHGGPPTLLVHGLGGLLVLTGVAVLSIYKPWGLTPFGKRRRATPTAAP